MGYSHYWRRPRAIPDAVFRAIRSDCEKLILPLSNNGVELAGGLGEGLPEISDDRIWFNGLNDCGHPTSNELGLVYPSEEAHGIGAASTAIDGSFHNLGVTVKHRCCGGRCSCETFLLNKTLELRPGDAPDESGLFCESVKTAFRPYDIAVTAVLLIARPGAEGTARVVKFRRLIEVEPPRIG
jgi:hypothetical protein